MTLSALLNKPIAHRGLHNIAAGIPENSPTAFQRAIDHSFAIECDIQLSADGIPMVIHDDTTDRVTGHHGTINQMTAAEITALPLTGGPNDRTLRFSELLNLVDGRAPLLVEMKSQTDGRDAELAQAAVKLLATYKGPLAFISFSPKLLQSTKKAGFKGATGIIVERFVSPHAQKRLTPWQRFAMRHMLHYPMTRFDFVDCDHKSLDLPVVRLCRTLGFPVAAWTIKSQAEAQTALKYCDQIAFEGYLPKNTKAPSAP